VINDYVNGQLALTMRPENRRDSGFSPNNGNSSCEKNCNVDVDVRDSVDSGVGSPSPRSSWSRGWGRRYDRRIELRKIELIKDALQELNDMHGGEVKFLYKPRNHPNMKTLDLSKTVVTLSTKQIEDHQPHQDWYYTPGYFLGRTGLTREDVLECRLPAMPDGGLAVISNGLAIDLYRIAKESKQDVSSAVAKFIFTFLELKFPPSINDIAVRQTMEHIHKNDKMVETMKVADCTAFLFSPFSVPEEVCEMASVLEDSEETLLAGIDPLFPIFGGYDPITNSLPGTSSGDMLMQENVLYGLKFVNQQTGGELAVTSLPQLLHATERPENRVSISEDTTTEELGIPLKQVNPDLSVRILIDEELNSLSAIEESGVLKLATTDTYDQQLVTQNLYDTCIDSESAGDVEEIIDDHQQEDSTAEVEQTDDDTATVVTKTDLCLSSGQSYGTNNVNLVKSCSVSSSSRYKDDPKSRDEIVQSDDKQAFSQESTMKTPTNTSPKRSARTLKVPSHLKDYDTPYATSKITSPADYITLNKKKKYY